jgi:predicted MFS family arabinose efflux permease
MLSSFAIMIGSFTAGLLWDYFGSQVPFLISSAVSLVIAVALLLKKPKISSTSK